MSLDAAGQYRVQITGIGPSPSGGWYSWVVPDPRFAQPFEFTGHTLRGGRHEIVLEALDERYTVLWNDPDSELAQIFARQLISRALTGLEVIPAGTGWEWHCANLHAAVAINQLLAANGLLGLIDVRHTPRAPDRAPDRAPGRAPGREPGRKSNREPAQPGGGSGCGSGR